MYSPISPALPPLITKWGPNNSERPLMPREDCVGGMANKRLQGGGMTVSGRYRAPDLQPILIEILPVGDVPLPISVNPRSRNLPTSEPKCCAQCRGMPMSVATLALHCRSLMRTHVILTTGVCWGGPAWGQMTPDPFILCNPDRSVFGKPVPGLFLGLPTLPWGSLGIPGAPWGSLGPWATLGPPISTNPDPPQLGPTDIYMCDI
eukprot:3639857-Karenia_brevis.AAC.1